MPEDIPGTPVTFLSEVFRKALSDVLSQAVASLSAVTIAEGETPASAGPSVSYGVAVTGGLRGSATFQIAIAEALWLAQKLLSEPAEAGTELNAKHKQAIQDLLTKAAKAAEAMFEPQFGATSLKINPIEAEPSGETSITLRVAESDAKAISLRLHLDADLQAAVSQASRAQEASESIPAPATAPSGGAGNLDLLLGVNLNLTLRFGQRTLTLREIMELSSGSIIELDRQVQEPADLLLGDKLIARGEVVVVDGNYGLRITEVAEPAPGSEKLAIHGAL